MLAKHLEQLLERYQRYQPVRIQPAGPADTVVSSHAITSRAGSGYEKVRNMLEYQEEHAVRRRAMERILRRTLRFGYSAGVGQQLLREFVSAGYLPNNRVPESAAGPVDFTIQKFMRILEHLEPMPALEGRQSAKSWCLSFAATEIHSLFFPNMAAELAVEACHATARERLKYKAPVPDPEKDSQTYIACRRVLLRSTDAETAYALWLKYLPDWPSVQTDQDLLRLVPDASRVLPVILQQVKKPLAWRIASKLKNLGIYYSLILELLQQQGSAAAATMHNPAALERFVRQTLDAKYVVENKQIKRRGIRAVAYIFFTKIIVAIGLEFPYDYFYVNSVDYRSLGVNVIFHPLLLMLMTSGITKLDAKNSDAAVLGVQRCAYDPSSLPVIVVNNKPGRGAWYVFFTLLYAALFGAIFGGIIRLLHLAHFNVASIVIFIFFLAMVSYFGLRIRHIAKRWKVETPDEGIIASLWGLLTLPIVRVGRWLSTTFSSINIFVFIMDFILEAPFKMVLRGLDAFLHFVRDKRDEVY